MKYEDLDVMMKLSPLSQRREMPYLGTHFLGTEWNQRLKAQVFNFHDPKLRLKVSVVFYEGGLYVSSPYGDTATLSDFDCVFSHYPIP